MEENNQTLPYVFSETKYDKIIAELVTVFKIQSV